MRECVSECESVCERVRGKGCERVCEWVRERMRGKGCESKRYLTPIEDNNRPKRDNIQGRKIRQWGNIHFGQCDDGVM